jgi:hypothetical protein
MKTAQMLYRLVEVGDRKVGLALAVVGEAAVAVGGRICLIELQRLVEVDDRAVILALADVSQAAVVVDADICWIELQRLVEVGDCTVILALAAVGLAPADVGGGILWSEPDRLIEIGDRPVVFVFAGVERGPIKSGFAFAMQCKGTKTVLTYEFGKDLVRGTIDTQIESAPKYSSSILILMRRLGDCPAQEQGKAP